MPLLILKICVINYNGNDDYNHDNNYGDDTEDCYDYNDIVDSDSH